MPHQKGSFVLVVTGSIPAREEFLRPTWAQFRAPYERARWSVVTINRELPISFFCFTTYLHTVPKKMAGDKWRHLPHTTAHRGRAPPKNKHTPLFALILDYLWLVGTYPLSLLGGRHQQPQLLDRIDLL